ncbi:alpha-amylase family glycosyl hydrolase, partial [Staphylococcus aureus]|uniref:alpha-amylase family glycosyl hydrolase n=1 Tax=Staphylococcus aureus TaxID=1280 RepID=UPI0021B2985E
SNYLEGNQDFRTMHHFQNLIKLPHQKHFKLILHILINHTSTHHESFKQPPKSKHNPYTHYYFFTSSQHRPPTNS